jgi:hypothetical protein
MIFFYLYIDKNKIVYIDIKNAIDRTAYNKR